MGEWLFVLDADGEPFAEPDVTRWAEWFEAHFHERVLVSTDVAGVLVSTVFLAIDHNFVSGDDGPPVLWETKLFAREGYSGLHDVDGRQWRYSSRLLALAHHDQLVVAIRGGASVLPTP